LRDYTVNVPSGDNRFYLSFPIDQLARRSSSGFGIVTTSGISPTESEGRRKIPTSSSMLMMSPDSTVSQQQQQIHHVVVPAPASAAQVTAPIQLVHANSFPPPPRTPPSAAASATVTCATPDLPPPPTPLPSAVMMVPIRDDPQVPPKAAMMNFRPLSDSNPFTEMSQPVNNNNDDINNANIAGGGGVEVYDDVMQCVYDDVDTKYDVIAYNDVPLPPVRKRLPTNPVINTVPPTVPELNKPLPDTPSKMPFMSKLKSSDKKDKCSSSSKNKSAKQEEKKQKQIKADHQEAPGETAVKPVSLFQRLFSRSKSVTDQTAKTIGVPPIIPPHKDDNNGNPPSEDQMQMDENSSDLKELQDFIDAGNLDQLDNMVTEFAQEYLPETMDIQDDKSHNTKNNNVASINQASAQS
jgi:hypothetical protein